MSLLQNAEQYIERLSAPGKLSQEVTNDLQVNNNVLINKDLQVNKDLHINKDLKVSNKAEIKTLEIKQDLLVNGDEVIKGELTINDVEPLSEDGVRMLTFDNEGETISVIANKDSEFVVLAGEPLKEKVATYGPFVMNTQEEIQQAMIDYQNGKMGSI